MRESGDIHRTTRPGDTRGGGFTIIEIMISLVVIAVLISLITVGVRTALRSSKSASEQFMASGLRSAVEQFKNEFGFLPPLVNDGEPLGMSGEGPVIDDPDRSGFKRIAIRTRAFMVARTDAGTVDTDIVGPVNGFSGEDSSFSDKRYSKFSLPFYLMGECAARHDDNDKVIDGVAGSGFVTPARDGRFDPRGRKHEPFFTPQSADALRRQYVDPMEFREHLGMDGSNLDGDPASAAVLGIANRPFRYFRWENLEPREADSELGEFMNLPKLLQDPNTWADPDASSEVAEYRAGSYAVIGSGPDGVFGTETVAELEVALGKRLGDPNNEDAVAALRKQAMSDNSVEVGR